MNLREIVKSLRKYAGPSVIVAFLVIGAAIPFRGGMEAVGKWWDLIRIALVFGLVASLIRGKWDVGAALIAAAVAMGALFPIGARDLVDALSLGLAAPEKAGLHRLALEGATLLAIVYLINILGGLLAARNGLKMFMESLEHLVRDVRYVGAMIPAAIGPLPTPGGALITAPFVAEVQGRTKMDVESAVLCNYWFRHIWEYWWPLFPAIIFILATVPGITAGAIMLAHIPLTVVAIVVGYLLIVRRIPKAEPLPRPEGSRWRLLAPVLDTMWPLLVIVVAVGFAPKGLSNQYMALYLLIVCGGLALIKEMSAREMFEIARKIVTLRMAILILGVFALRAMFDTTQAAKDIPDVLKASRIPIPVVCFFVPWIVGLLTGYTLAGVATTFPLLAGLIVTGQTLHRDTLMLAYVGSFLGVMISPVHLCLVLTREYFSAKLDVIYRRFIPMYLIVLAAVAGLWAILRGMR